ncbi:MAG: tripartite tricarboxylate transporter TctB family protein [Burkholderiales bacterium]
MAKVSVEGPQDLGAAVVFIVIGIAGLVFGQDLAFGTSAKMGPGYFPMILSGLILLLGIGLCIHSLVVAGPKIDPVQFRPILLIVASILVFGYLLALVGLVITAFLMTVVAAYARREVDLRENIYLGLGLAIFVVAIFVYGLSQPLPIWWWAQ